jgi:DAK2 domain fusion protein YloV
MSLRADGDLEAVHRVVAAALATLEASRQRIDDLNVYPVPDGDTGTNLTMTVRAVAQAVEESSASDRHSLARDVARGALMGARGNSGVIFSQIVRGAADVLALSTNGIDAPLAAQALRGASDAAYRAVRRPVEGTMLSVIRELAEEAEQRAVAGPTLGDVLVELVRRGEEAVARTPEQLDVLREAGVVDAGGAGLLELVRGVASAVSGEPVPEAPPAEQPPDVEAIHQELSRYRYCTVFVIEGEQLDRERLEDELERLGDSLLVVGDESALKVHVHTDEPGAALSLGTAAGAIAGVEIANMHEQTQQREERLLAAVPDPAAEPATVGVVAVVAGEGNRRLFESLAAGVGPIRVVEGGQTMNPSTADLLEAVASLDTPEAILLPNNSNVLLAAEQAALHADRPAVVVPTDSIPAGLAAMVAFDGSLDAAAGAEEMREAVEGVATGEVTVASRDVGLNGLSIRAGEWLGLADGDPVAGGTSFEEVAEAVVECLLREPRELLTLLTGSDRPDLDTLLARLAEKHPTLEVDVQDGGQPHYPLLLSAE